MDFNTLLDDITRKVLDRIGANKHKIIVLAKTNQNKNRALLENGALSKDFEIEFALIDEREINIDHYHAVILFDLTCASLAKIAIGVSDTKYSALVAQAILMGKKIFVPNEEIELFKYKDTAPDAYYKMMLAKLNFLKESGIVFCGLDKLKNMLIAQPPVTRLLSPAAENEPTGSSGSQIELYKRVVTESDIRAAATNSITCIVVKPDTIMTDLARDYARECEIEIISN